MCPSHFDDRRATMLALLLVLGGLSSPSICLAGDSKPGDGMRLPPLTADEQRAVDKAIERGVEFLRRTQLPDGSWRDGSATSRLSPGGYAALPGLALLESKVPPEDEAIQRAAGFLRDNASALTKTYDISLTILFLDRLGAEKDRTLIRSLCLRLVAGQNVRGGWSYQCPVLNAAHEKAFLDFLRRNEAASPKPKIDRDTPPASLKKPPPGKGVSVTTTEAGEGDNSNTQFAILALFVGRRYDLPLSVTIAKVELRFRSTQQEDGWGYHCHDKPRNSTSGSMTCVGLLALALGQASESIALKAEAERERAVDNGINLGLRALASQLDSMVKIRSKGWPKIDLYCLWTVERTAVLCGLGTIGGRDWYRWGVSHVLPAQKLDGSWLGHHCADSFAISTSMALLFLKRSDLFPDVRESLQKRIIITDPGATVSPGETKDVKKGEEK